MRALPLLLAAAIAVAPQAHAVAPSDPPAVRVITVPKNKSAAFRLAAPAGQIVVSQPETAEIVATTDHSFYVRGKAIGSTNLLVYAPDKRLAEVIDVRVGYDAQEIEADLKASLPAETITVTNSGDGLLLSGDVSTTAAAGKAKALAERYAPQRVNSVMTVRASQQIILEVRVLEATRSALQDFGIDIDVTRPSGPVFSSGSGLIGASLSQGSLRLSGSTGSTAVDVTMRALEEKGLVRTLARPNLVALSGEKASFLAGGEFPFPVPQGLDTITIEFRSFGVKLDFEPVIQDNGLIRLKVAPEVSQLDPSNSLRIGGFSIPGLTTRRASTTVELREGETFAIAGLFQKDYVNAVRQVPGLGNVPVLGALFRSARWKRSETELMIIVTPRLATAGDLKEPVATPMAGGYEPTAIDLLLMGLAADKPLGGDGQGPR